ncbi:MAG: nitroreductase/quinone reductase family protein [Actinomycetota bacterium]
MTPERLDAVRDALARDLTIDIVTLGARSGEWRTTEIWYVIVDGRIYICGTPAAGDQEREYAPRDWMANLKAHPEFRFVLKESLVESIDARATVVTHPDERRRVFSADVTGWYRRQTGSLDALVAHGPMVRVEFLGPAAGLDLSEAG